MAVTLDPRTGAPVIVSRGPALSMAPGTGGPQLAPAIDEGPPNYDPSRPPNGWSWATGGDGSPYWRSDATGQWYNPDNGMLQSASNPGQWSFSPLPGHTPPHPAGGTTNAGNGAGGTGGNNSPTGAVPTKPVIAPGANGQNTTIGNLVQVPAGGQYLDPTTGQVLIAKEPTWVFVKSTEPSADSQAKANAGYYNAEAGAATTNAATNAAQAAANIAHLANQDRLADAQLEFEKGKALGVIGNQETLDSVIQRGQLAIQGKLATNTIAGTMGFDEGGRPTLQTGEALGRITLPNGQVVSTLARDLGEAESRRADVATNLSRQQQAYAQGNASRDQYRQDVNSGLARQGQQFNQQRALVQEDLNLARSPQDYASYLFMKGGIKPPPGVGLFDVLAKAGKPTPDVETYLGGQGLGSVRATGIPNVPTVEDFLYAQDQAGKGGPPVAPAPVAATAGPALAPAVSSAPPDIQAELDKRRAAVAA